ncbi:MAG: alpha-L-fucosidase [Bryobacterales bacterium]|nr:alpha-L-fucosidase [Bryobacterales bacterium]
MNRRRFTRNLAGTAALGAIGAAAQDPRGHPRKIEPDWEFIHTHQVPKWYRNAKLGIFIHPFTRKGDSIYAFLLERPSSNTLAIPGVIAAERSTVRILGASVDSEWARHGRDLQVTVRGTLPGSAAVGVRITPEPWQVVKS